MGGAEASEREPVHERVDYRLWRRLWQLLRPSAEAMGAMAAGLGARLAEVGGELPHLAAVVRDERDDLSDPCRLGLLAPVEALGEPGEQVARLGRMGEQRVALAGVGGLQLDEAPLLEVVERGDDPTAFLAERGGGRLRVDARPEAAGPAGRDHAAEEVRAGGVEAGEDVVERAAPSTGGGSRRRKASPA